MKRKKIACPSSVGEEGSHLLGIVNNEGTVSILSKPLPVTKEFLDITRQGTSAEQRFRFTNTCIERGCKQWTGHSCGVIEKVMKFADVENKLFRLPKCGIRQTCRWYMQAGSDACMVCPLIITDSTS